MCRCIIIIISLSFFMAACRENPQQYTGVLSGQVLNNDGFNYELSGLGGYLGVSHDGVSVMLPDYYGRFYFDNVTPPYDLNITSYFYGPEYSSLYLGLGVTNPVIVFAGNDFESMSRACTLPVRFPAIQKGKFGILKFISSETFSADDLGLEELDSTKNIELSFMTDRTNIRGKLLFFQCTATPNRPPRIMSFDNFGMKDVELYEGFNNTVVFAPEEISYNPDESSVFVSVMINPVAEDYGTYVYIHFPGLNPNSDIYFSDVENYAGSSVTVPAGLKIPFDIKVFSNCVYEDPNSNNATQIDKSIFLNPGESGILDNSKMTPLIYPLNEQKNVSDTVIFRYGDEEPGAYRISMNTGYYYYGGYGIFTDKKSISLKELKNKGVTFPRYGGHTYWSVTKFSDFENIDQFVRTPYIFQENLNSIMGSTFRTFTVSQ